MAGSAIAFFTAPSILLTMSAGKPFGPITEYQLVTSKPLIPTSLNVGTSGNCDKRCGVEIASAVADGPYSVILEQVTHGVSVRMAVLYLLSGQNEEGG